MTGISHAPFVNHIVIMPKVKISSVAVCDPNSFPHLTCFTNHRTRPPSGGGLSKSFGENPPQPSNSAANLTAALR